MLKKIIVTGANGFTGKYMVHELLENGYEVVGTYHKKLDERISQCEWYKINLTNLRECELMIKEVHPDAIIHLAAQNSIIISKEMPEETVQVNILSILNILNSVRICNFDIRCILAGTSAVYKPTEELVKLNESMPVSSINIYALTKNFQEQLAKLYCNEYRLDIICTRPFNYTGYKQSEKCFIPSICRQVSDMAKGKKEKILCVGNLQVYRDFLDVRDVVHAYRLLLDENVKTGGYNISSGKALPLIGLVQYICGKVKDNIKIRQDISLIRQDDNLYMCGDNLKLKQFTGWFANYNIYETIDWIFEKMMEEI